MNASIVNLGKDGLHAAFGRRSVLAAASVLAVALFLCPTDAKAQTAAKTLKLRNSTSQPVEYGLQSTSQPPLTTIVIQPGQTRTLYPVPGRDALWYRYRGTTAWAAPYAIPFFQDPVYKWKFTPSGSMPGLVGAPEIP